MQRRVSNDTDIKYIVCFVAWQFVFVIVTPVLLLVIIILTFYFCRKRSEPVKYVEIDSNQKLRNFEVSLKKIFCLLVLLHKKDLLFIN